MTKTNSYVFPVPGTPHFERALDGFVGDIHQQTIERLHGVVQVFPQGKEVLYLRYSPRATSRVMRFTWRSQHPRS